MQIEEKKNKLRAAAKKKRDSLQREEAIRWSDAICKALQEQLFFQEAETVCLYYPLGNEVNLLPLARIAIESGKQAAFPRVNGSSMEFYQVSGIDGFAEGAFHVMEPVGGNLISAEEALILVPGLAFDGQGRRMGYGKGYYDRYFSRHPACQKAGICYEMQKVEEVPCSIYDISMDLVVTEQGIVWPGR